MGAEHTNARGDATVGFRRLAARSARGLALAGAALSLAVASAAPAGAPPAAHGPFCQPAPREWTQSCVRLMDDADRAHAQWRAARLTTRLATLIEGRRRAAETVELAYIEAARACAGADRWSDAIAMTQRAASVAAGVARRDGRPPRPTAIPQNSCPGRSPTRDREAQAFDAYVRAERAAAVDAVLSPQCLVDGPDAPAGYQRAAADRRCAWLAAAGADRAARGARAAEQDDAAAAMRALTDGLSAFDAARDICRGRAGADAALVRHAILEALAETRGETPPGLAEVTEIRRPMLEEGGRSLAELFGTQQARNAGARVCHPLVNAGPQAESSPERPGRLRGPSGGGSVDLFEEIRLGETPRDQS